MAIVSWQLNCITLNTFNFFWGKEQLDMLLMVRGLMLLLLLRLFVMFFFCYLSFLGLLIIVHIYFVCLEMGYCAFILGSMELYLCGWGYSSG